MPALSTLDLSRIVDVVVTVAQGVAPRATFNELLIIGTSGRFTIEDRLRSYESLTEMAEDGFLSTDYEYLAAQIYFSQSPKPRKIWIGIQDNGSPAETCLQAVQACREASSDWYYCVVIGAEREDHEAIADWIQTATPSSVYCFTTSDADVLTGTDDIFSYMKEKEYSRVIGQYSTKSPYAVVAAIGYACGQNTGLANSAFTLKFKEEVGISTEPLTTNQIGIIEANYGNVYLSYGNYYNLFEQGTMGNGAFFDQILYRDMLCNYIQLNVMDLLYSNPKIPQTDAGVSQIQHSISQACDQLVSIGYIAPGIWRGEDVLNLKKGDALPQGYVIQAQPIAQQAVADKAARMAPPIYVAINEAGAVHSVLIAVNVAL